MAEKIILFLQQNNNRYNFYTINSKLVGLQDVINQKNFAEELAYVRKELIDLGYIKQSETGSNILWFSLTKKGENFKSFNQDRQSEAELLDLEREIKSTGLQVSRLQLEDLINKLTDYSDNKWKSNWSFCISVATFIIAVIALIVSIIQKG